MRVSKQPNLKAKKTSVAILAQAARPQSALWRSTLYLIRYLAVQAGGSVSLKQPTPPGIRKLQGRQQGRASRWSPAQRTHRAMPLRCSHTMRRRARFNRNSTLRNVSRPPRRTSTTLMLPPWSCRRAVAYPVIRSSSSSTRARARSGPRPQRVSLWTATTS